MSIELQTQEKVRAPTQAAWDAMSEEERKLAVASLPFYVPNAEAASEGEDHFEAKAESRDKLRRFFHRTQRKLYVGVELAVYYPGETYFVADLFAVREVDTHPRNSWIVTHEGKGLDLVLEVLVAGERKKDLETNKQKYASLGISEYFVFDHAKSKLLGWRLVADRVRLYEPLVPQGGKLYSSVLDLELCVQGRKLRFYQGNAELLDANGIIEALEDAMDEQTQLAEERILAAEELARLQEQRAAQALRQVELEKQRADEEKQRAELEKQRAEQEKQRAELAEKELALLRAELAKTKP